MRNITIKSIVFSVATVAFTFGCTDKILDEIDVNPNSPENVNINLLLPQAQASTVFTNSNTDLAWYASVFVEHTTGVHAQLLNGDQRIGIDPSIGNNIWTEIYAGTLKDLNIIIQRGSVGGAEEGNYIGVGIAEVLKAYNLSLATDIWGNVPNSQALKGAENLKPAYDQQKIVYDTIQTLLNKAVRNLSRGGPSLASADVIYSGNAAAWIKTAYAFKARFFTRLSKQMPDTWADSALANAAKAYTTSADNMVYTLFEPTTAGANPWYQESQERAHHAVSKTIFDIMDSVADPRIALWFTQVDSAYSPAPNGNADNDQANLIYSDPTELFYSPTAPIPVITYDEMKFIESEAQLAKGNSAEAYTAYEAGIRAALVRGGVSSSLDADAYFTNPGVGVGAGALSRNDVLRQKYISFWLFQPIEAYNDWRRTDYPRLTNTRGLPPRRFPYAQNEYDTNFENLPNGGSINVYTNGVWWDDGKLED